MKQKTHLNLFISNTAVSDFCERHNIRKLAFFGSILRDDFQPDSDIDVLVEFDPDHIPGFIRLAGMELEFSELAGGREIDMNTPNSLSPYFRERVIREAKVVYG